MANYKLIFEDLLSDNITAEIRPADVSDPPNKQKVIDIVLSEFGEINRDIIVFTMDKSTAIKFAKTLRTEINKITESEDSNG